MERKNTNIEMIMYNVVNVWIEVIPNDSGRDKSDSDELHIKSESVGHHANHGHSVDS